uniref:Histone H3-K56 acetyltransferase, RTT109 n=1 Tax=Tanacetum cinerariifolium TaxID=118510 RepID=A0A699L2W7_TANCI|nr:histone H3-K56 acetyltransferase, RTT109 [Tanacetum cinerariifolium]
MHTCQSGETNLFSEVAMNNATLDTTDKDDVFVNSFFETRDAFLNIVQGLDITALYNLEVYCKPRVDEDCRGRISSKRATSETASKAAFDAGDVAARYCFIYSRLCLPSKEIVGGSKSEQLHKQKSLALKAVLDTLIQPKEQTKALYSSAVILYTSPGEIALCGLT